MITGDDKRQIMWYKIKRALFFQLGLKMGPTSEKTEGSWDREYDEFLPLLT